MTSKVIHQLQGFSNAIPRLVVQHFARFQLTAFSRGPYVLAELLDTVYRYVHVTINRYPEHKDDNYYIFRLLAKVFCMKYSYRISYK